MAKFGIALGSGPRGLGFESRHSDQKKRQLSTESCRFFCFLISSLFTLLSSLKKLSFQRRDKSEERKEKVSPSGMILKLSLTKNPQGFESQTKISLSSYIYKRNDSFRQKVVVSFVLFSFYCSLFSASSSITT